MAEESFFDKFPDMISAMWQHIADCLSENAKTLAANGDWNGAIKCGQAAEAAWWQATMEYPASSVQKLASND